MIKFLCAIVVTAAVILLVDNAMSKNEAYECEHYTSPQQPAWCSEIPEELLEELAR